MNSTTTEYYKVAEHVFSITNHGSKSWGTLAWHYEPFITTAETPLFTLDIFSGEIPSTEGSETIFNEPAKNPGEMTLCVYRSADGGLTFTVEPPTAGKPTASLHVNAEFSKGVLTVAENNTPQKAWTAVNSTTTGIMLMYLVATTPLDTLMAHASAVEHNGKAYLFLGKSGTGKSTHSRLWLENIAGTALMNDDHPILRISNGVATAYGSPWSGKTDCYRNISAPIGAIVRIKQAPFNRITPTLALKAYASLVSSFSGMTWIPEQADSRHHSIEQLAICTPPYELECLPDKEAALLCNKTVAKQ